MIRKLFITLLLPLSGLSMSLDAQSLAQPSGKPSREVFRVSSVNEANLNLQLQKASGSAADVLYVHGATFGADLSIFHAIDGRSWSDAINSTGLNVWGFDFAGYGQSDAYAKNTVGPAGRMVEAVSQIHRIITFIKQKNGNKPVFLVAHSWGASTAIRYAGQYPENVKGLVVFAPVVTRTPPASPTSVQAAPVTQPPSPPAPPSVYPLSVLSQYRRFVEDVPKGQPQVFNEAHFLQWSSAYLATDKTSAERLPPSVITPFGPVADIMAMWSGQNLYDATLVKAPTLLIRGAWDSLCTDADASKLMGQLSNAEKSDIKIERATHLMHLESERMKLHIEVNNFLGKLNK
jgi:pimeloyl-ACP methyl ester carboxylesterase